MSHRVFNVDDNYFNEIDNQNKSYILGLLYADGCNYENTGVIKIDLQIGDEELLNKIKDELKYDGELKHYEQPDKYFPLNDKYYKCKEQVRLVFRSHNISEQLALKGCVSNKTYTLKFPNTDIVSEDLQRHFIRGYMDGDGGLYYWVDNENTGHKKFQVYFCGTIDIIKTISKMIGDKFNCCPAITDRYPDRDNNNLQDCIAGNRKCKEILDWLYEDANIYMERKHNKYLELIDEVKRVENDTTLYGNAYPRRAVINLETKEIYSGVNAAAKVFGVCGATVFAWCHKHKNVMYLDEYEKIDNKDVIINNKLIVQSIKIYCVEKDKIYNSRIEASRDTEVSDYTIKRQCDGFTTRNNTYHFRYV